MRRCTFVLALAVVQGVFGYDRNSSEVRHCVGECQQADLKAKMITSMKLKELEREECHILDQCPYHTAKASNEPCVNGMAGEYPCDSVDLLSFTPLAQLGTPPSGSVGEGNDIWGWTDPDTKHEWALMGLTTGTSFVDVSDPTEPLVVAFLPSTDYRSSIWRDIKVFKDHAYIISEARDHGMQVFDLTRLRSLSKSFQPGEITRIEPDVTYDEFGSSHNIVINEDTGFGYSVGSKTCRGGLHVVDLNSPKQPKFVGCFSSDGYTHDAQCVVYKGPDKDYYGHEICFNYNEDSLTIVDVEDKDNMKMLARKEYEGSAYSHQGWLTEDHEYLLLDDELDEMEKKNDQYTQTYIWDVRSLEKPKNTDSYYAPVKSVDHNMYILGDHVFQANYCSGLRVLDISKVKSDKLTEVGFFDVRPGLQDEVAFFGSWSVYPYFESGSIIVSSIERGLFVLKFNEKGSPTNSTL